MYSALSLKTGLYLAAATASYQASRDQLLTCPECGEAVFLKHRLVPNDTPYFAHYKELESIKLIKACSLRVFGSSMQRASVLLPGLKHGQLVDRFQREFLREIHTAFGRNSDAFVYFMRSFGNSQLGKSTWKGVVAAIHERSPGVGLLKREVSDTDVAEFDEGLDDVCQFLRSSYGRWVTNLLHHTASFISQVIHPDTLDRDLGRCLYTVGHSSVVFVAEPFRLRKRELDGLPQPSGRRAVFVPQIASTLTSYLLLKWRWPKLVPMLVLPCDFIETGRSGKRPEERNSSAIPINSDAMSKEVTGKVVGGARLRDPEAVVEEVKPHWRVPGAPASVSTPIATPRVAPAIASSTIRAWPVQSPSRPMQWVDSSRLADLVSLSSRLLPPRSRLSSREEVLAWAGLRNPIEAYFVAAYMDVPHVPPQFADPTLNYKLSKWLEWVGK